MTKQRQRGSSIVKVETKSGTRWRFRIDAGTSPDGKRKQRTLTFMTEAEAVDAQARTRVAVRDRVYVEPSRITLDEYLDMWLETGARRWRASTRSGYVSALKPMRAHLGKIRLQRLTKADIERAVSTMLDEGGRSKDGRSARTVATAITVIKAALTAAVRDGYIARSPAEYVEKPRPEQPDLAVWSAAQLGTFLDHVDDDPLVGAWHLSARGLRRGEVLGLRWSDVDFAAGTVTVRTSRVQVGADVVEDKPKTERGRRTLPLDSELRRALLLTRERTGAGGAVISMRQRLSGHVVVGPDGDPLPTATYSRMFKRLTASAELPDVRLHDLRHTSVSLMLMLGTPVATVAAWHGHDPAMTLRVYGHVQSDALKAAGAAFTAALGNRL